MANLTSGTLEERRNQLNELLAGESPDFELISAELDGIESEQRAATELAQRQQEMRDRIANSGAFKPAQTQVVAQETTQTTTAPDGSEVRQVSIGDMCKRAAKQWDGYRGGQVGLTISRDNGETVDLLSSALQKRAVLTTDSSTGGGPFTPLVPQSTVIPVNPDRPLRIADIIDRQVTTLPIIEYVRDTTAKGGGNAAEVAEAGTKAETVYTFDLVSDTIKTVAHWTNITRAAVADHAQLQAYLQGRLLYGLGYRLDSQILNGDGTGANLRGILNTSGINLYDPASATVPYSEARVISIRRGMTPVYNAEYAPTAVVMNPDDWQLVELSQDNQGMFRVSPNVQDSLNPRIWGLNVVPTTAIAAGTSLVGDFRLGATLWDRQEATIYITDSHASNFTANVLTLLAELRVGLAIHRLGAFTEIVFNGNN
jgi:HK97 family phage major capsid protein